MKKSLSILKGVKLTEEEKEIKNRIRDSINESWRENKRDFDDDLDEYNAIEFIDTYCVDIFDDIRELLSKLSMRLALEKIKKEKTKKIYDLTIEYKKTISMDHVSELFDDYDYIFIEDSINDIINIGYDTLMDYISCFIAEEVIKTKTNMKELKQLAYKTTNDDGDTIYRYQYFDKNGNNNTFDIPEEEFKSFNDMQKLKDFYNEDMYKDEDEEDCAIIPIEKIKKSIIKTMDIVNKKEDCEYELTTIFKDEKYNNLVIVIYTGSEYKTIKLVLDDNNFLRKVYAQCNINKYIIHECEDYLCKRIEILKE